MEYAYALTSESDVCAIVTVIIVSSIMTIACIGSIIYFLRRLKLPPKRVDPSEKLTMSYGEQRALGAPFGGPIPDLKPRLRALKARRRRQKRKWDIVFLATGIVCTIFEATYLTVISIGLGSGQSLLNWSQENYYVLLAPSIIEPFIITFFSVWVGGVIIYLVERPTKDMAPIRLNNHTNIILKTYIRGKFTGEVHPDSKINNKKVPAIYDTYFIEVRDDLGNTFLSKEYNLDELDSLNWNIVINEP